MPKISRTGCTPMQKAYALRTWGAKGRDKRSIALDVGYSRFVAASAKSKIENTKGFNNAMVALAAESNNLALSVLHEFKARGLKDFSNKDLVGALNAIGSAWSKFNAGAEAQLAPKDQGNNRLRTIVLNRIENQQVINQTDDKPVNTEELDF